MYAQLGDIKFEGLVGFQSFDKKTEANYAEHALIGGKPRLQRVGSKLDEITLGIRFHRSFCLPEDEVLKLTEARDASTVLPFVTGAGDYIGDFVIKAISESPQKTFSDGTLISTEVSISLVEYAVGDKPTQKRQQAQASGFANAQNAPVEVVPLPVVELPSLAASQSLNAATSQTAGIQTTWQGVTAQSPLLKSKAEASIRNARKVGDDVQQMLDVIDAPDNVGTELYAKTRDLSTAGTGTLGGVTDLVQACQDIIADIDANNLAGIPAALVQVVGAVSGLSSDVGTMRQKAGPMIAMAALKNNAMAVTKYITKQNDRWDLIAHQAYGDASLFPAIMAANPGVPAADVLPANITLNIPVREQPQQAATNLPPWKR